jgi:hypothetical protein
MGEWMSIDQWVTCASLERPGYVFELRNEEGLSLFTACTPGLPETPFDWRSPPIAFRLVPEAPPERSGPIPPPATP